ncbi:MAG TPA: hypothetical protein VFF52_07565 [Isosphaeraceae bacterium]|nr:hypothetical protein [Isosphaeraceae bacterium]
MSLLVCGVILARDRARAQPPGTGSGAGQPPARDAQAAGRSKPDAAGSRAGNPARGKDQAAAAAQAQPPRREPSQAFRDSIRQTLQKRRQRRARRAQGQGLNDARPIGAMVPWPMPPALIIRHTPEVHREIDSLLGGLRR